jgi:FkbM family methyltransferase
MKIIYRENLGVFWLRHAAQRLVKLFRKGKTSALKICAFPDDHIGRDIAIAGAYEAAGIRAIKWMIGAGIVKSSQQSQFIDVGANVGMYTLSLAECFQNVAAFEPHPVTRKVLELNVAINGLKNISVSSYALSNKSGPATLEDNLNNTGAATLEGNGGSNNTYSVETKIASTAIKEMFNAQPISLIKIDVEGHELKVIEGLTEILASQKPVIAFEANDPRQAKELIPLLNDLGYVKFIALDLWPSPPLLVFKVFLLTLLGVRYALTPIKSLEGKKYSLVFALDKDAALRWDASLH